MGSVDLRAVAAADREDARTDRGGRLTMSSTAPSRPRPLAWVRQQLRRGLFRLIDRVAETDDGRAAAAKSLDGLLHWRPDMTASTLCTPQYSDLGCASQ